MEDASDDAPVPPMVLIYQQTLNTFDDEFQTDFSSDFNQLKSMLDTLKAEDLKFDKRLWKPEIWTRPGKAPCTHVEVFLNGIIGMSIVMMKPGFTIPLHDHPLMHGLLKVIAGKVRIKRFTKIRMGESPSFVDHAAHGQGTSAAERIYAQAGEEIVCTENSETCVLTPTTSNFHEIETLEEPAAFFTLLSKPYANPPPITMHQGICIRRCNYYEVVCETDTATVELKAIMKPDWFRCDSAEYKGNMLFSFGPY